MTEPQPEPQPETPAPDRTGGRHQLTVADCLHIAIDAIDAAAMAGHYAGMDASGKGKIRAAQNALARMAVNAQHGQVPEPRGQLAANPTGRKGTKRSNNKNPRKRDGTPKA